MKVAIISDIHANFFALEALKDVLESSDVIICSGDMTGYYCQVNEVIEYLRSKNAICILGNHDVYMLMGCPENISEGVRFGIEFADAVISNENRRWLRDLPLMYAGFISGRSYFLVHGSPWDSINHYLYQDNPLLNRMEEFKYDLVVFGQTHRQFSRDHQGRIIVNPGSVGQSREKCGAASAAIYDTDNGKLELIQRPYDTRPVIDMARNNGAGTWIEKHLI